jgi:integrase
MTPKKRRISKHGQTRWEVDFGVDPTGKKRRQIFRTDPEADAAIDCYEKERKRDGEYWARLRPLERQTTVAILQEMQAKRLTLNRVWAEHQKWSQDAGKQETTTPMPYEDAVKEFRRRKLAAGKSERYVEEVVDLFKKFGAGREKKNIHEFLPGDLEEWLDSHEKWSKSSRRTNTLRFSSLWEVAIAKGWCTLNIVDRLEPVKVQGPDVRIYPNETSLNLLAAVMSNELTQQIIAPMALGFFGCMRPEEVESAKALRAGKSGKELFGWHDIDLKHGRITVRPGIAKTGDQRVVRLQPVAVEWLKLAKELDNPLPAANERRLVDQCCELIGLEDWIRDGLRKSCATHLRAVYKNDYDVVKDMGNSIRVLLKHYADLHVPESVSLEHWKFSPERVGAYLKTEAWKKVVEDAAKGAATKASGAEATEVSAERPIPKASGTSKLAD